MNSINSFVSFYNWIHHIFNAPIFDFYKGSFNCPPARYVHFTLQHIGISGVKIISLTLAILGCFCAIRVLLHAPVRRKAPLIILVCISAPAVYEACIIACAFLMTIIFAFTSSVTPQAKQVEQERIEAVAKEYPYVTTVNNQTVLLKQQPKLGQKVTEVKLTGWGDHLHANSDVVIVNQHGTSHSTKAYLSNKVDKLNKREN